MCFIKHSSERPCVMKTNKKGRQTATPQPPSVCAPKAKLPLEAITFFVPDRITDGSLANLSRKPFIPDEDAVKAFS